VRRVKRLEETEEETYRGIIGLGDYMDRSR
jgi:hypothetical protein